MRKMVSVILCLAAVAMFIGTVNAAVPQKINYQGYLTNPSGTPLTGTYSMVFSLCDAASGGICPWTETQNVSVDKGIFNVALGAVTLIPLVFDIQYYLDIQVGGEQMTTRQPLTSVGYAFRATEADGVAAGTITNTSISDTAAIDASKISGLGSLAALNTVNNVNWSGASLSIVNGGTGQTSANAAFNALAPSQVTHGGKFLTTDGVDTSWATVIGSQWIMAVNDLYYNTGGVGIGNTGPNASALLDLTSTTKGLLAPRMTQAQRDLIGTPATGLLIYQTNNTPGFYTYNGSAWVGPFQTSSTGGTVTSVDGSGGTTGLSLTGGPITASGTLTLGGTLAVSNGGTGIATVTTGSYLRGNGTGALVERTPAQVKTDLALVKADVGLGNVANVDTTNASNLTSGTVPAAQMPSLTGDVTSTTGSTATTVTRLQGVAVSSTAPTSGQVLTYNSGSWGPAAAAGGGGIIFSGGSTELKSGINYYSASGNSTANPNVDANIVLVPVACTASKLQVSVLHYQAGDSGNFTATLMMSSSGYPAATALTCMVSQSGGAGTINSCSDLTHSVSIPAGAIINLKIDGTGVTYSSWGPDGAWGFICQ